MRSFLALAIATLLVGCKPYTKIVYVPSYPPYQQPHHPEILEPEPPKPKLYLVISCRKRQREFESEQTARSYKSMIAELGLSTNYRVHVYKKDYLMPHSLPDGTVEYMIVQRDAYLYIVSYWTDGEIRQEVYDASIAESRRLRLIELGCSAKIEIENLE